MLTLDFEQHLRHNGANAGYGCFHYRCIDDADVPESAQLRKIVAVTLLRVSVAVGNGEVRAVDVSVVVLALLLRPEGHLEVGVVSLQIEHIAPLSVDPFAQ